MKSELNEKIAFLEKLIQSLETHFENFNYDSEKKTLFQTFDSEIQSFFLDLDKTFPLQNQQILQQEIDKLLEYETSLDKQISVLNELDLGLSQFHLQSIETHQIPQFETFVQQNNFSTNVPFLVDIPTKISIENSQFEALTEEHIEEYVQMIQCLSNKLDGQFQKIQERKNQKPKFITKSENSPALKKINDSLEKLNHNVMNLKGLNFNIVNQRPNTNFSSTFSLPAELKDSFGEVLESKRNLMREIRNRIPQTMNELFINETYPSMNLESFDTITNDQTEIYNFDNLLENISKRENELKDCLNSIVQFDFPILPPKPIFSK